MRPIDENALPWQTEFVQSTGQVTLLLNRWAAGSDEALRELLPLVLEELRRLAHHALAHGPVGATPTLQPTALVNEAYLRLVDIRVGGFESRKRFFALAANILRNILLDYARSKGAHKRGGAVRDLPLSAALQHGQELDLDTAVAVGQALERLEATHPRQAKVTELRLFGGLTMDEIAEVLHRSRATVERDWALGRRRLARELEGREGTR